MTATPKIIVLDDDPTGSQTVHSCLLLARWDVETLKLGLEDDAPIFFILTNTRSQPPDQAAATTREVCHNLRLALDDSSVQDFLVVSRSDSTLRGHYPIETDVIAEELGPFDAHFLIPAFFEGGRVTRDSIHYLHVDGKPVPVHETEFARDSVFGYRHSYLPDYVAEKTQGKIVADRVERFLLADIRAGSQDRLSQLHGNQCAAVDGETQADLDRFAADLLAVAATGKRFLLRSAASILTSLAALPPQPIAPEAMAEYGRSDRPGIVLVGSHVKKTTEQLTQLLKEPGVEGVEIDVAQLINATEETSQALLQDAVQRIQAIYQRDRTPVIYTSRQELQFDSVETRLQFGTAVSHLLMDIVRQLPTKIRFLISKGGITSNDVVSKGLALQSARLLGQVLAGCSVIRTPADHPQFPNLPVVLFPGNVGDATGLAQVYRRLKRPDS